MALGIAFGLLLPLAAAIAHAPTLRTHAPTLHAPTRARHGAVCCSSLPQEQRWGPVIQGPFGRGHRATVRRELVPGRIWSFEQVQGLLYVHVPVRMTAVRLDAGGLLLYSAVAPTVECLRLLAEVEAETGPVRHSYVGNTGPHIPDRPDSRRLALSPLQPQLKIGSIPALNLGV